MKSKNVEAFKLLGKTAKCLTERGANEIVSSVYHAMAELLKEMSLEEKEELKKDRGYLMQQLTEILEKVY